VLADSELIERSLVDGASFEAVFDRHYPAIFRFLRVRAGLDAAEDLASETFLIAFRRRGSYDLAFADAAPWLFGIAVNLLRSYRRGEEKQQRAYVRVAAQPHEESRRVEPGESNGHVAGALQGLSEEDRDLIVLFAWAELSYEELGVALDLPVGTVRSRLSRVRARLRERLSAPEEQDVLADGRPS
jgi:RNA polymerase sigma factor (sigma-70 family)